MNRLAYETARATAHACFGSDWARLCIGLGLVLGLTLPGESVAATDTRSGTMTITERPGARTHEQLISWLEFDCEVSLPVPGDWNITAALSDREQYFGWLVPGTAFAESLVAEPAVRASTRDDHSTVTTDPLGRARFRIRFGGNDLAHLDTDGPWHLCLSAFSLDSTGNYDSRTSSSAMLHAVTGAWRREQFESVYSGELDPYPEFPVEMRGGEELVFTQGWDLVVATVVRADTGGTLANPPGLTLRVGHVFQGRIRPGIVEARWSPEPLVLPCPVGEESNIARWKATPNPAPAVGSRWIFGGFRDAKSGDWVVNARCRWPYADSTFTHFQNAVWSWKPRLAKLRRLYELGPGPGIRAARRERNIAVTQRDARQESERRAKLEAAQREERARRAREAVEKKVFRARSAMAARSADLEALTRQSGGIVVGQIDLSTYTPGTERSFDVPFLVEERLRAESDADTASRLTIRVTPREASIAALWHGEPSNRTSLGHRARAVRGIAFLRHSTVHPPYAKPHSALRLVDGTSGLLPATPNTVSRVRAVIAADNHDAFYAAETPGTTWQDFAGLTPDQLAECVVKFSPMFRSPRYRSHLRSLALWCRADSTAPPWSSDVVWSRAFPDSCYRVDRERAGLSVTVRPEEMASLLDSLLAIAPFRERRVEASDSVSVTLWRRLDGRDIQLERTLDRESLDRLAWILIHASPADAGGSISPPHTRPVDLKLVPWVAEFRPNVFALHMKEVWRTRYGSARRPDGIEPEDSR